MTLAPQRVEEWSDECSSVRAIERALASLREASERATDEPEIRTSVLTHIAWVPEEWREAATRTLAGLAERHPSRGILLVPDRDGEREGMSARVSVLAFPLAEQRRRVLTEVIELRLHGRCATVPASIVTPLLIPDLPVFLRWRGQPPFGAPELEQLVELADRLIVDSSEWPDLSPAYRRYAELFERVAASDIAWARTRDWRIRIASLWPGVADVDRLDVKGPHADAVLVAGWLRSRLKRAVELVHEPAEWIEAVLVNGDAVEAPRADRPSASDLLSGELDEFSRDPVYEAAARAV